MTGRRRLGAHTRINHAQEHRVPGRLHGVGGEQIGRGPGIQGGGIGEEVHHRYAGRLAAQHGLDLAAIGPGKAKVFEEDDQS